MATYNVTAQTRRVQFTGNGTAGPFAFSFQVNATSEIKVYVDSTVKTESSHYTVSLNSGTGAGTVSFTSGNHPSSSETITILGSIPLSRTSVYTSGGQLTASSLEDDFDTNMFVHQQTNEEIDRSLRLAEHDVISGADMTLPVKDTRKGTVLGFNATTGNPEAGPNITSVQSLANVTTAINLLGTSAVVEDLGILGTTAIVEDMSLLATSSNVSAMALLGVSSVITDMGILGTADIVEDMGFLGTSANVTAMGHLGTSANVTAMGKLGNDATVADMAILGTDAVVANMATLATSDIISDLNTLATSDIVSNLNTVADNISGVNSFAERYRVGSSDPSSSLNAGDLAFNSSSNVLKFYDGSAWQTISAISSSTITGQTAETSIADDDLILLSDTSASGALKKMTKANFVTGLGSASSIADTDSDTQIQVEESSDEDKLRFDTGGTERAVMDSNGIALTTNGGSFIHHNTIANDTTLANQNMLLVGSVGITGTLTIGSNSTVVVI